MLIVVSEGGTPATIASLTNQLAQYSADQYQGDIMTEQKMRTADYVSRYIKLTKEVLPRLTQTSGRHWPVRNDHCFQRIVLDTICGGTWYDHISRPAYKHLTRDQALQAVALCDRIISGEADLAQLNKQSLIWRQKLREGSG